jgi:hypothetical protein
LNASGNFQFVEIVGGTSFPDDAYSVAVAATGSIKIAGRFMGTGIDFDPDPSTEYLLSSQYPTKRESYLWSLSQTT